MPVLFFHGGPGLNSFAEEQLLKSLFADRGVQIDFWNEPSNLRQKGHPFLAENSFSNWLNSAEQTFLRLIQNSPSGEPVYLIGHSFGAHAVTYLTMKHSKRVSGITFAAPVHSTYETQKNILRVAYQRSRNAQSETAYLLEDCLGKTNKSMDSAIQRGFELAFQDPLLFTSYWYNPEQMQKAFSAWNRPESQFDVESFWQVSLSLRLDHLQSDTPIALPVQAIFGKHDLITSAPEEIRILSHRFLSHQALTFENAAHFPHLECPDRFVEAVVQHAFSLGSLGSLREKGITLR